MHIAGATGGLLAGVMVATLGYGALNAAAGVLTLPLIVAIAASVPRPKISEPAR
jgi:predicted MFS family arabinose efflux permease